jgi:hypothetical protein
MKNLEARLAGAIRHYWRTRLAQKKRQGAKTGDADRGNRAAVTGGAQLDGFVKLIGEVLAENGIPGVAIHKKKTSLPGYFRPTKEWDIVVTLKGQLIATIEFKSQAGPSYGNNFNNRVEEALGSATDLWKAYEKGAFRASRRPWLGYFFLLEEDTRSTSPVSLTETHFPVFPEFRGASYRDRYRLFCERLMREGLYDSTCFLMSDRAKGRRGNFSEPSEDLSFRNFIASLVGKAVASNHQRKQP